MIGELGKFTDDSDGGDTIVMPRPVPDEPPHFTVPVYGDQLAVPDNLRHLERLRVAAEGLQGTIHRALRIPHVSRFVTEIAIQDPLAN